MKWLAILVLLLPAGLHAQEAQPAERGWAACRDLADWDRQERVRHDAPADWLGFIRSYVVDGRCRLTRRLERIVVVERLERRDAHPVLRVRLPSAKGDWWLSPEAVP